MGASGRGRPPVSVTHECPASSLRQNAASPPSGRRQPPGPTAVTHPHTPPGRPARDGVLSQRPHVLVQKAAVDLVPAGAAVLAAEDATPGRARVQATRVGAIHHHGRAKAARLIEPEPPRRPPPVAAPFDPEQPV